jgi:hypothetical protein
MKTNSANSIRTKAFSLTGEDVEAVERIKAEEGMLSDSAALRVLIRDGLKFRRLRQKAEHELMKRTLSTGATFLEEEIVERPTE